jgi:hypothetical protein
MARIKYKWWGNGNQARRHDTRGTESSSLQRNTNTGTLQATGPHRSTVGVAQTQHKGRGS